MEQELLSKINVLTKEQYDLAKTNNTINENELYFIPEKDELLKNKLVNIYSSDQFSSSITLEKSASNFDVFIIEIEGNQYTDNIKNKFLTVINPNNKILSETIAFYNFTNNQIYLASPQFQIQNNTITITNNTFGTVGASTAYGAQTNAVKIVNVWGMKK